MVQALIASIVVAYFAWHLLQQVVRSCADNRTFVLPRLAMQIRSDIALEELYAQQLLHGWLRMWPNID